MAEENLRAILQVNKLYDEQKKIKLDKAGRHSGPLLKRLHSARLSNLLASMDANAIEFFFDTIIAQVIVCNAVFVGVSLDYEDGSKPWLAIEIIFAIIFWAELLLKLWLHGLKEWYCGAKGARCRGTLSNIFDTCIVFADTLQLGFTIGKSEGQSSALDNI